MELLEKKLASLCFKVMDIELKINERSCHEGSLIFAIVKRIEKIEETLVEAIDKDCENVRAISTKAYYGKDGNQVLPRFSERILNENISSGVDSDERYIFNKQQWSSSKNRENDNCLNPESINYHHLFADPLSNSRHTKIKNEDKSQDSYHCEEFINNDLNSKQDDVYEDNTSSKELIFTEDVIDISMPMHIEDKPIEIQENTSSLFGNLELYTKFQAEQDNKDIILRRKKLRKPKFMVLCDRCDYQTKSKYNLKRHVETVHLKVRLPVQAITTCEYCAASFSKPFQRAYETET